MLLAKSLIKHLQLTAQLLPMNTKLRLLPKDMLLCMSLVRIRPTNYHEYSHSQLVLCKQPNISHLLIFSCVVYVPQHTKMGPQRRLGIYVGFDSPSIIRYLEPITIYVFIVRFMDYHFSECILTIKGIKSILEE